MTVSYTLVPIPKWYLVDFAGRPLAGGSMNVLSSLNKTLPKQVYMDSGGRFPWPNPVLFDANGTQGPFFWQFDTNQPSDSYFLEVYDASGNLQWTIDGYGPGVAGGGGGGSVTTNITLKQYIINNLFWRNNGNSANPIATSPLVLSPSSHAGFSEPDFRFIKNNFTAVDNITFGQFGLANDPLTNDVTPEFYCRYQCTNAPAGETQKVFQFPIDLHVKNLEATQLTLTIWAINNNAGDTNLIGVQFRQFYGSGTGGSADFFTSIGTLSLTTGWTKFVIPFTTFNNALKTTSGTGDDASYLQIVVPLGVPVDFSFTKPSVYLGNVVPQADFDVYDQIDAVINAPRTGDIKVSANSFAPYGWVLMNDGTIADGVGQAGQPQARWNQDTFQLYSLLWPLAACPLFTQAGAPTAKGVSAVSDFQAHNQLGLPKQLGRLLASVGIPSSGSNTGTNWATGQSTGNELHTMVAAELIAHTHDPVNGGSFIGTGNHTLAGGSIANTATDNPTTDGGHVGGTNLTNPPTAMNIQNPVTYYNVLIKL